MIHFPKPSYLKMKCVVCNEDAIRASIDGANYCLNHGIGLLRKRKKDDETAAKERKRRSNPNACHGRNQTGSPCRFQKTKQMKDGRFACSRHNTDIKCKCGEKGIYTRDGVLYCDLCFEFNRFSEAIKTRSSSTDHLILGVRENATREEIRAAYLELVKNLHPDKNQGDESKTKKFKECHDAMKRLMNKFTS